MTNCTDLRLLGFVEEDLHHATSVELDADALSHDLGREYQIVEDSGVDRRQRAARGGRGGGGKEVMRGGKQGREEWKNDKGRKKDEDEGRKRRSSVGGRRERSRQSKDDLYFDIC